MDTLKVVVVQVVMRIMASSDPLIIVATIFGVQWLFLSAPVCEKCHFSFIFKM